MNGGFLVLKVKCLWSLAPGLLTSSTDMIDKYQMPCVVLGVHCEGFDVEQKVRVPAFQNIRVC